MNRPSYARWLEWTPEKTTDKTDKNPAEPSSVGFVGSKHMSAQKKTAPTPDPGPEHNRDLVAAQAPGGPGAEPTQTAGAVTPPEPRQMAVDGDDAPGEAIRPLQAPAWSPECLTAGRKFNIPSAKLYPLLNHLVLTPEGAGILVQVFDDRVQVHLKDETRTRQFRPEQIAVAADARQAQGGRP